MNAGNPSDPGSPAPAGGFPAPANVDVRREIARGGMGIVYLGFDPALNRFVAIKRLAAAGAMQDAMRARFLREARAMAALNHIHICRIYAVGEDAGGPFIAMEYIAGPDPAPNPREPPAPLSLETLLQRNGPLRQDQMLTLIGKIAGAVDYAHRRGVIHRDLKPANVLFDEHGEPRLVDFGLAALRNAVDERITMTGDKLLSLGYGAPEQEKDAARVDHRADVYALGGLVYFCLTGENPRYYRDHRVPSVLRAPLLQALEQDREQRWPSVTAFMEALAAAAATDAADPVAGRDGWICKWCHALNTVADRYCCECRWDGLVLCPQCNEPMRFGIRHCPACGTDLRSFEDADGLADLLRELRRQKQFDRLLDRARQADALRDRGAISEPVYRQIVELRQGAVWALQRKEELRQAIAAETAAEDYERVRELLNEYDIIDNGDTYGDLRARLPEKIAARHVVKLYQRWQTAQTFMDQKKLASCRAMMAALRDQQQWIASLTENLPLRHSATPPPADADPAEATMDDPASLWAICTASIDRLDQELTAEETRIQAWQTEAEEAFRNQDYDHCLRLCREVELLTVEPTPTAELMTRAMNASRRIDQMAKAADQALADRRWQEAGALAGDLLAKWKANHAGARHILTSLARQRRTHRLRLALLLGIGCLLGYILMLPPVQRIRGLRRLPAGHETRVFRPITGLYNTPPLRRYAQWWGLHNPDPGAAGAIMPPPHRPAEWPAGTTGAPAP